MKNKTNIRELNPRLEKAAPKQKKLQQSIQKKNVSLYGKVKTEIIEQNKQS